MVQSKRAWYASLPNVVPTGVCAPAKAHRAIAVEELLEESTAGQPHPAACVHAEICIQEQLVKYLDGKTRLLGDLTLWLFPNLKYCNTLREPKPFC